MPHAQSTIALYTELDAMCDQQSTIVVDRWPHLDTSAVVAKCYQQQTVYSALGDG